MNDQVRSSCTVCGGYGIIHDDSGAEMNCPKCSGTGFQWYDDEVTEQPTDVIVPDVLPTDK